MELALGTGGSRNSNKVLRTFTSVLVSFSSSLFSLAGKDGLKSSVVSQVLRPVILVKREHQKKILGWILFGPLCVVFPSPD